MAIRCQTLQALQQRRGGHEGHPEHERPGPSEADNRRSHEIAEEVLDLPTERRARLPIGGAPAILAPKSLFTGMVWVKCAGSFALRQGPSCRAPF